MNAYKDLVYLIDMDGTLYRGSEPIPHAPEFISYLQQSKRKFLLVTNCPGESSEALVEKLSLMGITIDEANVISSGDVVAEYLCSSTPYSRVYLVGSHALKGKLEKKGIEVVNDHPDCVVVGYDKEFDYKKMKEATQFILDGAGFVCTNCDFSIPEGDKIVPHTGSIAAGIEMATGRKPVFVGKPEHFLLDAVIKRLGCNREQCCIIGDRLDTDICFGVRQNIFSFLVLTGITNKEMLVNSQNKPTMVFEDLLSLMTVDKQANAFC